MFQDTGVSGGFQLNVENFKANTFTYLLLNRIENSSWKSVQKYSMIEVLKYVQQEILQPYLLSGNLKIHDIQNVPKNNEIKNKNIT